jgi:hypothetical protein
MTHIEKRNPFQHFLEQKIHAEQQVIGTLIENSQDVNFISLQPYWAKKDESGEWVPNVEGRFAIRALILFLEELEKKNAVKDKQQSVNDPPILSPCVVIAGGEVGNILESEERFQYNEALKLLFMQLFFDQKGILLERMARSLGRLKRGLLHREHQ